MKAGSFLSLTFIFMIIMAPIAFASSITNYTYDPNGNMLSDGEFNYTYDAANQMVTAIKADTGDFVEEYLYDHSGNRVKKIESTDSGNKTTYYISGLYEITVNPDGLMTNTTYVYANGERVARNETNENGSTVYYYHSDHLHSTSVVTTQGNLMSNLTNASSDWQTVTLAKSLVKPVIVAKIISENDTDNAAERITNASSDSFVLMIEETGVFDGNHPNESVAYIALEEGTIANGAEDIGEAGTVESGPIWTRVTFEETFNEVPVVIASPMTQNDATQGVVRVKNVYKTGFDIRFEEYDGGDHPLETIGWMAVKPGTHTLDGKTIVAGSASVNSNYSSVSLSGFSSTPAVITQIQSYTESDYGAHTRVTNASSTGFEIKIEENNDTSHATETIGYIAIEPTVLKSGSAKIEETKYYPYGVIQEGGSERYLYTGKEKDAGTGLYYYEARYYSPSVGRFIQADTVIPDPYNPQSLNRYAYVLNNPLRYVDPTGNLYKKGALISSFTIAVGVALIFFSGGTAAIPMAVGGYAVGMGAIWGSISLIVPEEAGPAVDATMAASATPGSPAYYTVSAATSDDFEEATLKTQKANAVTMSAVSGYSLYSSWGVASTGELLLEGLSTAWYANEYIQANNDLKSKKQSQISNEIDEKKLEDGDIYGEELLMCPVITQDNYGSTSPSNTRSSQVGGRGGGSGGSWYIGTGGGGRRSAGDTVTDIYGNTFTVTSRGRLTQNK